jgi:hypothetical protein
MANNEFPYSSNLTLFATGNAAKAEENKMIGFLLNFILGFGIGSYVQGDTTGGTIGLCLDLSGLALVVSGAIIYANAVVTSEDPFTTKGIVAYFAGGAMLLGSRIFQLVRPFTYANSFSVAVVPNVNSEGQPALTALVSFKY